MADANDHEAVGAKIQPTWPPVGWEPIPGMPRSTRHYVPDLVGWIYSVVVPPSLTPSPPFFAHALGYQTPAGMAEVLAVLNNILQGITTMSGTTNNIDAVLSSEQADVAALVAATNQLITLVQGIPAEIAAAIASATNAGATPEQLAGFQALSATMQTEAASAVAAATAAAPSAPSAPAPDPNAPPAGP